MASPEALHPSQEITSVQKNAFRTRVDELMVSPISVLTSLGRQPVLKTAYSLGGLDFFLEIPEPGYIPATTPDRFNRVVVTTEKWNGKMMGSNEFFDTKQYVYDLSTEEMLYKEGERERSVHGFQVVDKLTYPKGLEGADLIRWAWDYVDGQTLTQSRMKQGQYTQIMDVLRSLTPDDELVGF